MKSAGLIVVLLRLLCITGSAETPSAGSYAAWQGQGSGSARDPAVIRWYRFDGSDKNTLLAGADAAELKGVPLQFEIQEKPDAPAQELEIIEGRWPGKKAIRLDRGCLSTDPFLPETKAFTASAWIRLKGPGTYRGNEGAENGTVLSVGSGYWDGWRLTVSYPGPVVSFEIGRPQPSHSIGIQARAVLTAGTWHHVAVAWDGREMRIFVDGLLSGSRPYNGSYTLPPEDGKFRIGFANHGVGSVVLDVDEVAVYTRALTAEEIQKEVEYCGLQAPGALRNLARICRERNDLPAAKQHLQTLLASPESSWADRRETLFDLGNLCRQMKDFEGARAAYAIIVGAKASSPVERVLAQFEIGSCHAQQDNLEAAKKAFALAGSMSGIPEHLKQEAFQRGDAMDRLLHGLPVVSVTGKRASVPGIPAEGEVLFVAASGDDRNPGTKEKPFATLERARDEIRTRKSARPDARKPVTVFVRGGTYRVAETFQLNSGDSGAPQAPVVYSAYGTETPRFTGGVRVENFTVVTDPLVQARLPENARGKIRQADLQGEGIRDYGIFAPVGAYGARLRKPMLELFFNGQPMEISRWPNDSFLMTGEVSGGETTDERGDKHSIGGEFVYDGNRPDRWKEERDAWLYGYWYYDWADSYEKIASIDTTGHRIKLEPPLHKYGFASKRRYYALNLLSEIDRPGEWYLDRDRGMLYLWPPSDPNAAEVEISVFSGPLVRMEGVSHVTFRGFLWDCGRGDGVHIQNGGHCLLAGCTVRNFAGDGVVVQGGVSHGLLGCDITGMGRGGVIIRGGDRKSLTPSNHFVENCHLHHLSRINHTYTPAVLVEGVGIHVAHNLMHDIGSSAMRVEGNDNLIEFNEVHDVVLESDDQGGVDMFGDPTFRGNIYRYNFFHHIDSGRECGQAGIRLDDAISGTLIYSNVFWRCSAGNFGGVQIHGGKDNIVDNNLFVDCKQAISFNPWGAGRWKSYLDGGAGAEALRQIDITSPPYSIRYPELASLRENPDVNHLWRNVLVRCGQSGFAGGEPNDFLDNQTTDGTGFGPNAKSDLLLRQCLIPFDSIGLYSDDLRKSTPDKTIRLSPGDW